LLIAALQERIPAVDGEARDPEKCRQYDHAQHEGLTILSASKGLKASDQLSTLTVRLVVRLPE
jgi:hypothetical protein